MTRSDLALNKDAGPGPTTLGAGRLAILVVVALALFVTPLLCARELSVHEAVLPQTARGMCADGDWLVPKRGDAPWLENPPLPQWITVTLGHAFGTCESAAVARLAAALMGLVMVVLAAWMAARWFDRESGFLAGLVMATTLKVVRYASLAEDEIFLGALVTAAVACFVHLEFFRPQRTQAEERDSGGWLHGLFTRRPRGFLLFFLLLGMTNLAKGLLFGSAMVLIPCAGFLLLGGNWKRLSRYVWLPGVLLATAVAAAWPFLVYLREPGALELWRFDLLGRVSGGYQELREPFYYYAAWLPEALLPWTLVAPLGLWATRHQARHESGSPERFLWCWALLVPAVLSLLSGKHHHYLLHALLPWAVLSARGLRWLALRPSLHATRKPAITLFAFVIGGFWIGQVTHEGSHHQDGEFLRRVRETVPEDAALLADMDVGGLRGFQALFYLPASTVALHNLSFLRDDRITAARAYVVTLARQRERLAEVGVVQELLRSERAGRSAEQGNRLTLFQLDFRGDLERLPADGCRISPMQAMYRSPGPFLGER